MKWLLIALAAVAVGLAAVLGVRAATSSGDAQVVQGEVVLEPGGRAFLAAALGDGTKPINGSGDTCQGAGGYDDLHPGTDVTIRDDAHKVIATASLDSGSYVKDTSCSWPFTAHVPKRSFYSFEVSHRGEVTKSRADLEQADWYVQLKVGD